MTSIIKVGEERLCDYCKVSYIPKHYKQRFCKNEHFSSCIICNTKFIQKNLVHPKKTCSNKCNTLLREKTNLERFGVTNPFQSEEKKEKIRQTNLKKYGTTHRLKNKDEVKKQKKNNLLKYGAETPFQSDKVKEKIRQTNISKYGVPYYSQTEEYKNNVKQTSLIRYKTENPSQSKEVKEKIANTNIQRYGNKCSLHGEEVKKKTEKTNLKRYGTKYPSQSKEIQDKIIKTNISKYGVPYYTQTEEYKEKTIKTNIEKYGVINVFQSDEIKEKIKRINLERYGVEYVSQSEDIQKKIRLTNIKKYGVPCYTQSQEFLNKMINTNLERYGVPFVTQSEEVKEKIAKTNLEKYGNRCSLLGKEIQKKSILTNMNKYGVDNPFKSKDIQEKIKRTNIDRYGVEYPSQSEIIKKKIQQTNLIRYGYKSVFEDIERMKETTMKKFNVESTNQKHIENYKDWINLKEYLLKNKNKYTTVDLMEYFNLSNSSIRQHIIKLKMQDYVNNFYSLSINEDVFIKTLEKELNLKRNIDIELHNRTIIYPYEIDLFFPKYNIGIEISPTWTHQYNGITNNQFGKDDKFYHYNKFKRCKDKEIELLTIFDWTDIDKIIKFLRSKIDNKLITIPARKTKVNIVDSLTKEHKEFLERNHILGKINNSSTTKVIELLYQDKVLGIGVFEEKTNYFELRRLAFESDYRVIGGASKIISNYRKIYPELKELITFSDNDLGTGNVYKSLGFKVITENKGTLIWYNSKYDKKIPNLSLVKQGTDRLLKNFPDYKHVGQGEDLPSNQEIIRSYGFLPIYDCGYTKWSLEFK